MIQNFEIASAEANIDYLVTTDQNSSFSDLLLTLFIDEWPNTEKPDRMERFPFTITIQENSDRPLYAYLAAF